MKKVLKNTSVKIQPIFGIGYWYDNYSWVGTLSGGIHNIILPFLRIQVTEIEYTPSDEA